MPTTRPATALDDQILDAVAGILEREGLRGLTMTAIAEEAGVSRVTLHRRGQPIEDYVIAVVRRASQDLRSALWPVVTGANPAADRFRAALVILCEVYERHAGAMAALFRVPGRPVPGQPGTTTSFEFIEPFEKILRDGIADGTLVSDDPRADATLVANSVAWTYLHMRKAHRWSVAQATTRVVDVAIASLLSR